MKGARNILLREPHRGRFLQAIGLGATIQMAAAYAGSNDRTFRLTRSRAEGGDKACAEFIEECERAQAQRSVQALATILKAAKDGEWTAAAWYLERSDPDNWGRRERRDVTLSGSIDVAGAEQRLAELVGATVVSQITAGDSDSESEP